MKESKIHSNEKGNLLSIKPVDNTYSDRNYLISIIRMLLALSKGIFYIEASRPNYETNDMMVRLREILNLNYSFKCTDFEISFCNNRVEEELLEILPIIWYSYEHISFCFFTENKIEIDVKRKSWYEITTNSKSYVLFKGVEEDVLWIGKSNELEYNLELCR